MDYENIYAKLIEKRKLNPPDEFYDRHHIVPRCMNGSDDIENLVSLTYREHFVAHRLLLKIYPENLYLYRALLLMSRYKKDTSRMFTHLRKKFVNKLSQDVKER